MFHVVITSLWLSRLLSKKVIKPISTHVQVENGGVLLLDGGNLVFLDVVVNGENIQSLAGGSKTTYCNQYRVISPTLSQK